MKNFPDHDQFDELEKRLQSYTETPDEVVWENIDAALRPRRNLYALPWIDHITSAISFFVFMLALNAMQPHPAVFDSDVDRNQATVLQPNDNNQDSKNLRSMRADPAGTRYELPTHLPGDMSTEVSKDGRNIADSTSAFPNRSQTESTGQNDMSLNQPAADTLTVFVAEISGDSLTTNEKPTQPKRIPKRRPAFYVNVTPSLSFQRAIPIGNDEIIVQELSDVSILSMERFGIGLDLGIQGFVRKRFEYYGGLSLYHQNQTLKYSYQPGIQTNVTSSGDNSYIVTPKSSIGYVNYEMLNLGLQAGLLYNLYGKTLTHKIGAGVGYQHGLRKASSESYKNSESSYFSYQVFYRNEVRLGPRVRAFVQPVFLQSIRVREKLDVPFNLKPYRAGIGFGILYDLK